MSSCIGFHLHQYQYLLTALNMLSMMASIAPALYNMRTFQVAILISLILFHCLGRFHSVGLFRGHRLGFLTVRFLSVTGCRPVDQLSTWRTSPCIYNPRGRVTHLYPQALGTHFCRLLRSAWAAVGLFFSPDTTRG